ncbi:uncharacterized protein AB9W97_003853 [Spinachia spinachia]
MRTWLLLVSLLVSGWSAPGEGDRPTHSSRWTSCRKLLGRSPLLEMLETQSQHQHRRRNVCVCVCVCVAVQRTPRTSPFDRRRTLRDESRCTRGVLQRDPIPARAGCSLLGAKGVPVLLLRSDAAPALHVVSHTGRIAVDVMKGRPDAWTLHQGDTSQKKRFSATSAGQHCSEDDGSVPPGDHRLHEDEHEHFYYFDGVRSNLSPHQERERRRRGSRGDAEMSVFGVRNKGDTKDNLLRYIRRLTSGKKAGDLRRSTGGLEEPNRSITKEMS